MLNALIAFGIIFAYVAVGTLRYRYGHVKRELARQQGVKAPGWHGEDCASQYSDHRWHSCLDTCYLDGPGCKGGPRYSSACDCATPSAWAALWALEPFAHLATFIVHVIHRVATPTVTAPKSRLEILEERNAELEADLRKMGVNLGADL